MGQSPRLSALRRKLGAVLERIFGTDDFLDIEHPRFVLDHFGYGKKVGHIGIIYGTLFCLTPKELAVQPCNLSRQLFDSFLQIFYLFGLIFICSRQDAIEVFSPSIVLSSISFSSIVRICFVYVNILNISGLHNNIHTFVHSESILYMIFLALCPQAPEPLLRIFLNALDHHHQVAPFHGIAV